MPAAPALTPERFSAMQECFERALDLAGAGREAYLAEVAARDPDLAARVRGLLSAHVSTGSALERPLAAPDPLDPDRPRPDRWVGRRIGAYDIVRLVGAGGMGTVYEAVRADDQYRKRVAIKLLGTQATSETAVRRFRRERQILADLAHPHIAALLDGGVTEEGQPYFAMEYVEGEPITTWCDARSLPVPARLALFRQVCAAVQYAHQSLVVHRDLKPGNILVTPASAGAGHPGEAKLLDFGIAKLLPSETDDSAEQPLTRVGGRAYTPDYASPEQLLGQPIGTRSDVYALGVVLYELLTGARPFELRGRSAAEAERLVTTEPPVRPSAALRPGREGALGERSLARARARVAGDLDAIVLQALRKEPERRYGSAEELAADVARHLDGRPVAARPEGVAYRLGKFVRRRRLETAAVALAVGSLAAGVAVSTRQARVATAERVRAEEERARAEEVTSFLTTMLGAANPGALGRDVKVREVLDSAAARVDTLRARPALEAEVRRIIGGTYLALGEHEAAERHHRGELVAHARRAPAGDRATATSLARLSTLLELEGRFEAADSALRASTALFERHGYPDLDARIDQLDNQGRLLIRLGRGAEAERVLREALALQLGRTPRNDTSIAYSYTNLAVALSDLGKNAAAETLLVAGVAAAKRTYGAVHPLVAAAMSPLASIQSRAGALDRADSTYRATLAMRAQLLGEEHPDYAWTMYNYADHLMMVGRYAESAEWARRVLALRGRTLQRSHAIVPPAMAVLGRSLARMDSLDAAERWLRESLALRRTILPPGHFLLASSESILGEHLRLRKRYPEAEALLLRSQRVIVDALGDDAPIAADARRRIVELYEAWGKPAEAARWRARAAPAPASGG